jgi:nucleotide-binding universal stress UspA family protein
MGTIVVGVDGSEFALRALEWACREAQMHGSRIVAVHAWDVPIATLALYGPGIEPVPIDEREVERVAREALDAAVQQALRHVEGADGLEIDRRTVHDSPVSALIETARSEGADLIVVGTRGMGGFKALLLGSVATGLAHHSPVPVTIIPPPDRN